jgi:hypothetical protein
MAASATSTEIADVGSLGAMDMSNDEIVLGYVDYVVFDCVVMFDWGARLLMVA